MHISFLLIPFILLTGCETAAIKSDLQKVWGSAGDNQAREYRRDREALKEYGNELLCHQLSYTWRRQEAVRDEIKYRGLDCSTNLNQTQAKTANPQPVKKPYSETPKVPSSQPRVMTNSQIPQAQPKATFKSSDSLVQRTFAQYDPNPVSPVTCKKTGGLFKSYDRQCADKIKRKCGSRYQQKTGDPRVDADHYTCRIKSLERNFSGHDEIDLVKPFNIKTRSYYILAVQGNLSYPEAVSFAERTIAEGQNNYRRVMRERGARGLAMATMGYCLATHGFNKCFGRNASQQSSYEAEGFLRGSRISGVNRVCHYDQAGSDNVVTLSGIALCPMSLSEAQKVAERSPKLTDGFLKRNYVDGFNRVCIYNSAGALWVKTIDAMKICSPNASALD